MLEVVIAILLSAVLMLAVYEAFNLHWRFATVGRNEMERSQLARAILKKFELDVRSVVFRLPEQSSSSGEDGGEEAQAADDTSGDSSQQALEEVVPTSTDLESAYSQVEIGIMGSADRLLLSVSRPSRGVSLALPSAAADAEQHFTPLRSDLRSVMYYLGDPAADGVAAAAGNRLAGNTYGSAAAGSQGLVRKEGDAMEMAYLDLSGNVEALVDDSQLLAEEVNHLEFAYYGVGPSGAGWYDSWDSAYYGVLPQAIRVTVGFHPPAGQATSGVVTQVFSVVIQVPLAEPYPPEAGI